VRIFTEGVDYDNFYTIVVLGDTVENVGLSAPAMISAEDCGSYKRKKRV